MSVLIKRFLLITTLLLLTTSCLVNKGDKLASFPITLPATLRQFEGGEWTEYVISGYRLSPLGQTSNISGTMNITWSNDSITNPVTSKLLPVLRVTTTIDIGGEETATVQFFTQQPADAVDAGSLSLRAIMGTDKENLYWLETDTSGVTPEPVQVLWSPFETETDGIDITNHNYQFDVIGSCTQANCTHEGVLEMATNRLNSSVDRVETQYGYFDTYRMEYGGHFRPAVAISSAIDPRFACGVGSLQNISASEGSFYNYHPAIGIVRMINTCATGGYTTTYTATLRDTNINVSTTP